MAKQLKSTSVSNKEIEIVFLAKNKQLTQKDLNNLNRDSLEIILKYKLKEITKIINKLFEK